MIGVSEIIIFASFFLCLIGFVMVNNIYFLKGIKFQSKLLKNICLVFVSPIIMMIVQLLICRNLVAVICDGVDESSFRYKLTFSVIQILLITVFMTICSWIYSKIIHANINVCRFVFNLFFIVIICVDTISFNPITVIIASIVMLGYNYYLFNNEMHILEENVDENAIKKINVLPVAVLAMQFILMSMWNILPDDIAPSGQVTPIAVIVACFSIGLYTFLCISCRIAFKNYEQMIELKKDSEGKLKTQEEVILAFAEIVEAKSNQTGQHVKRVSEYSYVLATGMDFNEKDAQEIRIAAMMHDIGKLLIPTEILEKPGKLTPEEFDVIKTHVTLGENILHNAPGDIMEYAKQIALDHHEKWNGNGYLHKKGEEISLAGRIVAVADVYDALVSKRSYKNAWTESDAKQQIISDSGTHFDPHVVDAFVSCYDRILDVLNSFPDGMV